MPGQIATLFASVRTALTATRTDRVNLTGNAHLLLRERYLTADQHGEVTETPEAFFRRIAKALAAVEEPDDTQPWESAFYEVMARLEFHPGSRTLANAGSARPQLANCFVFPLEDSQASILQTFTDSSVVKGLGGGCGYNYSRIRPKGDAVRGTAGLAAGPVALLKMFDGATKLFRQRGRYESGNMAVLNIDHPDVLQFIEAKKIDGSLNMTNISLGISDAFMHAVAAQADWPLINPRTGEAVRKIPAAELFGTACRLACETGDPGLLFLDRMNDDNPLRDALGEITATNPCGEIGLYPYEACNLGYLNLPKLLLPAHERKTPYLFDEERLRHVVAAGVRMIDNAISVSWFPVENIREAVSANRRVGLGVTGWADCLAASGIPYDSPEALNCAELLASVIRDAAQTASYALGHERGPFPNIVHTNWKDSDQQPRNIAVLALPPSGNNAVIFDTAFSIEPFFGMTYSQQVFGNRRIHSVNQTLLAELEHRGIPADGLLEQIAQNDGSLAGLAHIPADLQAVFKTAHEIAPEWHVRMQAAFQRHVDNAVTKTVNLPADATPQHVASLYQQAWELGCKGITVYRDTSKNEQAIAWTTATNQPAAQPAEADCVGLDGACQVCE
ncbi:adenosylcobalamin-dependent ribonucleoside-diphosphate reductase [Streptomyces sp. G7(2002)]|uniref:adenosylcobalamin-dependent ribonucleoside-diphosphate reductase n=1 Tax=Streptomyces sp. G7(2002) TaxID=2971798 RepID=UPI00237EC8C4|nr:adenosylcobalamin-dependent ribonucleoside-diphosphate reductase [Streptomyces sp. G7(2002)]WDT59128.1 adenosylcobalamin-dependent ribonucleoside-diphosphate reductase [Streptomyces sp. G7(2002)]